MASKFDLRNDIGNEETSLSKQDLAALYSSRETAQAGPINGIGEFALDLDVTAPDTEDTIVRVSPDGSGGYTVKGTEAALELAQEIIAQEAGVEPGTKSEMKAPVSLSKQDSSKDEPLTLSDDELSDLTKNDIINEGLPDLLTPDEDTRYTFQEGTPFEGQTFVVNAGGDVDASPEANAQNTASPEEIEAYLRDGTVPAESLNLSGSDEAVLRKNDIVNGGLPILTTQDDDVRYTFEEGTQFEGQMFIVDGLGNLDASPEANPDNTASAEEIEDYISEQLDKFAE